MKIPSNKAFEVVNEEFMTFEGNRAIDEQHVNKIYRAILKGHSIPPILVDTLSNLIIDGQHRYEAFKRVQREGKEIGMTVIYDNYENPIAAAATHNNTAKRWNCKTYINAYASSNCESIFKEYINLIKFADEHPLFNGAYGPVYSAIVYLLGSSAKAVREAAFHMPKNMTQVENIYKELILISKVIPGVARRGFVLKGWIKARGEVLANQDIRSYCRDLKRKFITPTSEKSGDWELAFIQVTQK